MIGPRVTAALVTLAMVLTACSSGPVASPEPRSLEVPRLPEQDGHATSPSGRVRVVVPEEPSAWWPSERPDVAADDLSALWGLPLFRVDEHGQLRRGLVRDWQVVGEAPQGWTVELLLGSGTWTDGTPVTADDVAASVDAAVARRPRELGAVRDAVVVAPDRVGVVFDGETAHWPDLLVEVGGVLPLDVVGQAATTYDEAIPVSGGPFRLVLYEPGLRAVFAAHDGSALGTPRLAEVEVVFAPRYETALGLLEDGEVDVALGYLALNPVARAEEVDGVEAAAPLGGTTVVIDFSDGARYGGEDDASARRGLRDVLDIDLLVEGLLGEQGAPASTTWPEVPLPSTRPPGELDTERSLVLVLPGSNEVLAFTGRAIERDLTNVGLSADLVLSQTPAFPEAAVSVGDGALVIERTGPHPPLGRHVPEADLPLVRAGEAAGWPSEEATAALAAVAESAKVLPLFRPGVLHAWRGVEGLRPSAWTGAGFWNVGEWALAEPS